LEPQLVLELGVEQLVLEWVQQLVPALANPPPLLVLEWVHQ